MNVYRCKRCGMHRLSDRPPWCRHGDVELPANRMEKCPPWWVRMLGFSLGEKAVLRLLAAAQRPLAAAELHRFLSECGQLISKQAVRNRLLRAEKHGRVARARPEVRHYFERGAGRWFVPLDAEQSAESLTLADAERETELAALIESQQDELNRGDWIDSEKGHWADKSIDAPLTADGFTILDTLGDEDEALQELMGEPA